MAKRYLGYGYTNAQGVAKLEYDSEGNALTHSYTGVGAGKIDIVAESGTLQSETYEVLDCAFLDIATTGNTNSNWSNAYGSPSVSTDSTGTTITASSTIRRQTTVSFVGDFEILVNLKANGTFYFGVRDTNSNNMVRYPVTDTEDYLYKIRRVNGVFNGYISTDNGSSWSSISPSVSQMTTEQCTFVFYTNQTTEVSVTYRDLRIYPI